MSKPRRAGVDSGGTAHLKLGGVDSFKPVKGRAVAFPEVKYADTFDDKLLAHSDAIDLSNIAVGPDVEERIGSSVSLQCLNVSFQMTPGPADHNLGYGHCRLTVFIWHPPSTVGEAPTAEDIYTSIADNDRLKGFRMYNQRYKASYTILHDEAVTLRSASGGTYAPRDNLGAITKISIPLSHRIRFDDKHTPIRGIDKIWLLFTGEFRTDAGQGFMDIIKPGPELVYSARLAYTDQ